MSRKTRQWLGFAAQVIVSLPVLLAYAPIALLRGAAYLLDKVLAWAIRDRWLARKINAAIWRIDDWIDAA